MRTRQRATTRPADRHQRHRPDDTHLDTIHWQPAGADGELHLLAGIARKIRSGGVRRELVDDRARPDDRGRRLELRRWHGGDPLSGRSAADCPGPTNRISAHTFTTNQTFVVNLVVTDSASRTGSRNVNVTVALAEPNVVITTSPGPPNPGDTVQFNSNGTTYFPGSGPASFAWTFGDGCWVDARQSDARLRGEARIRVGLSVTDNKGRTGTGTATVTVVAVTPPTPPAPPVASFTFGPPSPRAAITNVSRSTVAEARAQTSLTLGISATE